MLNAIIDAESTIFIVILCVIMLIFITLSIIDAESNIFIVILCVIMLYVAAP